MLAGDANRAGASIQISKKEGHRFPIGTSTMVGHLVTLTSGVRTLFFEAGWPRRRVMVLCVAEGSRARTFVTWELKLRATNCCSKSTTVRPPGNLLKKRPLDPRVRYPPPHRHPHRQRQSTESIRNASPSGGTQPFSGTSAPFPHLSAAFLRKNRRSPNGHGSCQEADGPK